MTWLWLPLAGLLGGVGPNPTLSWFSFYHLLQFPLLSGLLAFQHSRTRAGSLRFSANKQEVTYYVWCWVVRVFWWFQNTLTKMISKYPEIRCHTRPNVYSWIGYIKMCLGVFVLCITFKLWDTLTLQTLILLDNMFECVVTIIDFLAFVSY